LKGLSSSSGNTVRISIRILSFFTKIILLNKLALLFHVIIAYQDENCIFIFLLKDLPMSAFKEYTDFSAGHST
jgi:hypothetical protein